jgi:hypothetical protein
MLKGVYSLIVLLSLFIWVLTSQPVIAGHVLIKIYWTDLGVNQLQSEEKLGDTFCRFTKWQKDTIIVANKKGQILVPMPSDDKLPKTEEGWNRLSSKISKTLMSRINDGLKAGIRKFEIRTKQHINLPGYFDKKRQKNVVRFSRTFSLALAKTKKELSSEYNVTLYGIWGSNGGYTASKVIPELKPGLIGGGILVDARAWKDDVVKLYESLGGNLAIINTGGDAPARPNMVACHKTSKALKKELPALKLYWVDPKGWNLFGSEHLKSMHWNISFIVKEFTENGYEKLDRITGRDLLNHILSGFKTHKKENPDQAVSFKTAQPGDLTVRKKYYSGNFPPPPPPSVSGVYISPEPSDVGNRDVEIKENILKSRPSNNTLSWPVHIPEKE